MEEIAIFRIFSSFPLLGLLIPDVSSLFIFPVRQISVTHLYVEGFLLLTVIICTIGIWYHQKQERGNNMQVTAGT
ncbi:hypothetical protein G7092_09705 [Mucilaginibacter sp. HC2]|uniref:hypothetical protein n=1 Tax=Mucilaginibacter inviolabilis TaxID=2714892 RepID=UPI00140B1C23|nr:hypothetical protein [Mucilaginibacter inviolabilis]NHA04072.1 hypothetical protein [Mucilaginibacter inviolabilis]